MTGKSATRHAGQVPVRVHQFFLCLLPVLLLLSHRNVVSMVALMAMASLLYAGAWATIRSSFARPDFARPGGRELFWLLSAFAVYALFSVLWTPAPERWGWALQLQLFFICGAGIMWLAVIVPQKQVDVLASFFAGAVFFAAVLLGIEGATGGLLRDIIPPDGRPDKDIVAAARGTAIAMTLTAPAILILFTRRLGPKFSVWQRRVIVALGITGLLIAAVRLDISANVLALVTGTGVAIVALWRPVPVLTVLFWGLGAGFVAVPFLALALPPIEDLSQMEGAPVSWIQRLIIWRLTAEHIFSDPLHFLFGGGINYGWWVSEAGKSVTLPGFEGLVYVMPTHPHNVFLQVWLEFGLAGVGLCLAALLVLWRLISRAGLTVRQLAAICAVIGITAVFALVETSIWTPWRLVAPLLAAYGMVLAVRSVKN